MKNLRTCVAVILLSAIGGCMASGEIRLEKSKIVAEGRLEANLDALAVYTGEAE